MTKIKKFGVIGLICCLILIIVGFVSPTKLYGKWYLYNGNDINTDSNISKQLNSENYIEISEGTKKEFRSDGKNGIAECKVRGNKMHSGDAILSIILYGCAGAGDFHIDLSGGYANAKYCKKIR